MAQHLRNARRALVGLSESQLRPHVEGEADRLKLGTWQRPSSLGGASAWGRGEKKASLFLAQAGLRGHLTDSRVECPMNVLQGLCQHSARALGTILG